MTLFFNEELRLLLEICILLLKAGRREISGEELDSICESHFKANNVAGRLSLLDKTLGLKEPLAIGTTSVKNNNLKFESIKLKYHLWYYEKMMDEIIRNKYALDMRRAEIWLPFYKEYEAMKEVIEGSSSFKGMKIRGKTIFGIGEKSICLIDDKGVKSFHWFMLPKKMVFQKNTFGDGFDLAKEILDEHDFIDDERHLIYILGKREMTDKFARVW